MRSTLFTRLLLIFSLLFAQMGSLTHGISHQFFESSHSTDQPLPHEKHSNFCESYAHIGSAVNTPDINFTGAGNSPTVYLPTPSSYTSSTFVAFAARAPPYSA